MKPSEYILTVLRKACAQEMLEEAKAEPAYGFLQKVTGQSEEEQLRAFEFSDKTTFAAILMYLDQTQPPVDETGSVSGPRTGQAVVYLLAILACLGIAGAYAYAVYEGWLR